MALSLSNVYKICTTLVVCCVMSIVLVNYKNGSMLQDIGVVNSREHLLQVDFVVSKNSPFSW